MLPQNKTAIKTIPAQFSGPQGGKNQQFLIICQFLQSSRSKIQQNYAALLQASPTFQQEWSLAKQYLKQHNQGQVSSPKHTNAIYSVASVYNQTIRLRKTLEQLRMMQERENNGVLPPPTPCQYIDTTLWTSPSEEANRKNWIGHGYYWKTGDCLTKDNYTGDYNTLEDNFLRITNAKVLMADYDLLRTDFPHLQTKSFHQVDQWLLSQTAFMSQGQIKRISPGGDLHDQLDIKPPLDKSLVDFTTRKSGLRYRGGGRAVNFVVDDKYSIESGIFKSEFINVKGVGSQKIIQGFGPKENGFLSLVDALKQYCYQKLIQRLSQKEHQQWQTIQTYAIIDIGLRYKCDIESPATGYKGDRLGLTVRQASSRFQSSPDQACYYSVVPYQLQGGGNPKKFIQTLVKWGVSSEQQPLSILNQSFTIDNLDGSWNIQSDGTLSRFVDFSQFYVLPNSKLPACWRLSHQAFLQGVKANKFASKLFLNNRSLMKQYFGTEEANEIKQIWEKDVKLLQQKYGKMAGAMRKPALSWSWFLETDDSEIQKFAFKYGLNDEELELSSKSLNEMIEKWLDF